MLIAFTLSMPQRSSWNGRWSGEDRIYCVIRSIRARKTSDRVLPKSSYYYSFGDGWCARIDVKEVDANEARKLRKQSDGSCGYDWMIPSIIHYGEITTGNPVTA